MRVYEFAKQEGISSKELLSILKKQGFELESHMSILTDEALDVLKRSLSSPKSVPEKKIENNLPPTEKKGLVEEKMAPIPKKELTTPPFKNPEVTIEADFSELEYDASNFLAKKNKEAEAVAFAKIKKSPEVKHSTRHSSYSRLSRKREDRNEPAPVVQVTEIKVDKERPLFEVATQMGKTSGELIIALLKQKIVCNRNQVLTVDIIKSLAHQFGLAIVEAKKATEGEVATSHRVAVGDATGVPRWPIVVVMGHVDHGKTTFLDFIRKTNVASREKGGITQHLGAYEVTTKHGKIVFLDTPGHAAFANMRRRGAKVTDIAILIVAADDGVMPQTLEALKSAQEANVTVIVAINKIDKVKDAAAVETIKRQLSVHNLIPEEWGGSTIYASISAKTGQGIDELLELIVLQSQLMELKAHPTRPAQGIILEASVEKGHGPIASVIFLEGTIKQGDYFVCKQVTGKVRLLFNSLNQKITQAGPSIPVRIVGFDGQSFSGDMIRVVSYQEYLEAKSAGGSKQSSTVFLASNDEKKKTINLMVKADTYGSVEVAIDSIRLLNEKNKSSLKIYNIINSGIGDISEGDIDLAASVKATIVALHVKVERNALVAAKEHNTSIIRHDIIYHLIDELDQVLKEAVFVPTISKKVGDAVVLKVFNIKGAGIITGALAKNGIFARNGKVVCLRRGVKVGEGKITSLQRNKLAVKEVHAGFDFAFASEGFNDWQIDDVVECYIETKAS